jgi:MFS family permease
VGAVVAASWVTFGLCQPLGARYADRTGRHRVLIVASLVVAGALSLAMGLVSLPWMIVAWVLLGIADGIGRPLTSALVVDCCQGAARANAFGLMAATDTAARIVAPLALAVVIQAYGLPAGFLAAGLVVLASIPPLLLVRNAAPAPAQTTPLPAGDAA